VILTVAIQDVPLSMRQSVTPSSTLARLLRLTLRYGFLRKQTCPWR